MKKIIILIFVLTFGSANSQINNLSDLLKVSKLTVYGLTSNLQNDWKTEVPTENYSEDGKRIIGTYTYTYLDSSHNQTLKRVITVATEFDYESHRTDFICNDKELLKSIKKNLPLSGFELKTSKPNYLFYNDGRSSVGIIEASTKDQELQPGFYMISLFIR